MKLKCIYYLCFFVCLSCSSQSSDFEFVKNQVEEKVRKEAEYYLNLKPITVTADVSTRSAGTINDFYSEGDYWWPNPKYPDSAYIRKDGLSNPDNFVAHRKSMIRFSQISGALASAYLINKDNKYLRHLFMHLNAWFVDESTKMNPHLLYAQAIKGRVTGRGIGIIDTIHLIEVALAVEVLEDSGLYSSKEVSAIKVWFSQYLKWLTTHQYGIKERDNGNNHSTCWALQVAAFAHLVGNQEQIEFCETLFKEKLLPEQMAVNGSFPKELARTKPYGYSVFNLDAMCSLAQILSSKSDNLFYYTTYDDKSLKLGLEFFYPYLEDKSKWPYKKDVMYWDDWPTKHPALIFGGFALNNQEYLDIWQKLSEIPNKAEILRNMPVRYPLLWIKK